MAHQPGDSGPVTSPGVLATGPGEHSGAASITFALDLDITSFARCKPSESAVRVVSWGLHRCVVAEEDSGLWEDMGAVKAKFLGPLAA
eukprot:1782390-Rhodomonas_salina.1